MLSSILLSTKTNQWLSAVWSFFFSNQNSVSFFSCLFYSNFLGWNGIAIAIACHQFQCMLSLYIFLCYVVRQQKKTFSFWTHQQERNNFYFLFISIHFYIITVVPPPPPPPRHTTNFFLVLFIKVFIVLEDFVLHQIRSEEEAILEHGMVVYGIAVEEEQKHSTKVYVLHTFFGVLTHDSFFLAYESNGVVWTCSFFCNLETIHVAWLLAIIFVVLLPSFLFLVLLLHIHSIQVI